MSGLRKKTVPKVALLASALAVGLFAATVDMAPAQAMPTMGSACTGCHTAGGSVKATPSSATPAAGAAFTVALAFTGGTSPVGYWISGNGANVTGSTAGPASVTAPTAAGTYEYTVWMRSGVVASTTFSITVGGTTPTTPPTTGPPTTTPPTTTPPTTPAPTTPAPTTPAPPKLIPSGRVNLSPTGAVGSKHLSMFKTLGSTCSTCHNGTSQAKPPTINIDKADMRSGACSSCHSSGDSDRGRGGRAPALFISAMKNSTVTYERCSDCHKIGNDGDSDGGGWGGGSGGGSGGGGWGGGGGGRGGGGR